jgi:hypothetical protein
MALPSTICLLRHTSLTESFISENTTRVHIDAEEIQSRHNNVFSSQISCMFRPNMVTIRLATRKKIQVYTYIYWNWNLSFLPCDHRDDDSVWSKHVSDLRSKYIVLLRRDLFCISELFAWILTKVSKSLINLWSYETCYILFRILYLRHKFFLNL